MNITILAILWTIATGSNFLAHSIGLVEALKDSKAIHYLAETREVSYSIVLLASNNVRAEIVRAIAAGMFATFGVLILLDIFIVRWMLIGLIVGQSLIAVNSFFERIMRHRIMQSEGIYLKGREGANS